MLSTPAIGGPACLLDVRSAVRANLPVRIQWPVAAGADVAHLGIAYRADDEILLDGSAALRAGAVLGKLTLAQGHVEFLLLAVGHIGAGAQHQVGDQAHERNEGHETPNPKQLDAAALGVDENVDDGEQVERDHEGDEGVDGHHQLRGQELRDVLGHGR